ncbi:(-)-isopiperitenol/(-)-carveol dehydrogenase, mitochondrial-like protein [Tanacetum coccineum]
MAEVSTIPTLKLAGNVSIITGRASGIGEATSRLFATNGTFVVIADVQDELGQKVANSIGKQHCAYLYCDISNEQQVIVVVEFTVKTVLDLLDTMFSNAGIVSTFDQTVLDLNLTEFNKLFVINARGTTTCVKHATRAMVEQGVRGCIICTTSVAASRGASMHMDYIMLKDTVLGLVRSASKQLGEWGAIVGHMW